MTAGRRALHAGMVRRALLIVLGLGIATGFGCPRHAPGGAPVARAFYFWRTTFALSDRETAALAELGVTRLYVRVFDVGWSEADHRATPLGPPGRAARDPTASRRRAGAGGVRARGGAAPCGGRRARRPDLGRGRTPQYRERTGVPPVDRGMLMFYNMGKLSAEPGARSIYDADAAERYLARVGEYPLPLDLALPIWSWTVQVRDGAIARPRHRS
jgi:hypothetical protein